MKRPPKSKALKGAIKKKATEIKDAGTAPEKQAAPELVVCVNCHYTKPPYKTAGNGNYVCYDCCFPKRTPIQHTTKTQGRNEPCACGSGKKYKKCCLGKS